MWEYLLSRLRFVHAADLHLDSPFSGMRGEASEQIADTLHKATFDAYDNIIKLCLDEQVDALLVAGDIYDGADRSLRAQLRFVDGLKKLEDAGIRSFICHGNHDPLDGWDAGLDLPRGCVRFGPGVEGKPIFPHEPERAMVYGISYPKKNVSENLSLRFTETKSEFSIGLLHANVGNNTGHDSYAPCTVDDLVRTRYQLLGAGPCPHPSDSPRNGSSRGLFRQHPRTPSQRARFHGVYLVDVDEGGTPRLEFREVDGVRWKTLSLDIGEMDEVQDLINAISNKVGSALEASGGRSVIVRIEITGRGRLHRTLSREGTGGILEQINKSYGSRSMPWIWCGDISLNTASPIDREEVEQQDNFTGYLARLAVDLRTNQAELDKLKSSLQELYLKPNTSPYLREYMPSGDKLRELLAVAEDECLAALVSEADDA